MEAIASGSAITCVQPQDLCHYREGIIDVYRSVFTEPPWNETDDTIQWFAGEWLDYCASLDSFRCVVAESDGAVVGFAMGIGWASHTPWFHALGESLVATGQVADIDDSFFVLEIALLREYRCHGIGGQLHDALLATTECATALLSTNKLGAVRATVLFVKRGWRESLASWTPWLGAEPCHIMALDIQGREVLTSPPATRRAAPPERSSR